MKRRLLTGMMVGLLLSSNVATVCAEMVAPLDLELVALVEEVEHQEDSEILEEAENQEADEYQQDEQQPISEENVVEDEADFIENDIEVNEVPENIIQDLASPTNLYREADVESEAMISVSKANQEITMDTTTITKKYGSAKFQIKASAKTPVTYTSSDKNVLTVDGKGNVTIVAKNSTKSAYVMVNAGASDSYNKAAQKKVLIKWTKADQKITVSKTSFAPTAKNKAMGAKAKTGMTYKTSNTAVATVNAKGQITAKKAGTAKITITAKSSNQYNSVKKVVTIKVEKQKQTVTASNKTFTLGAKNKALGAKASSGMTYKSANTAVATVNAKGQITAKKAGTAKITITAKATKTFKSAKKTITVTVKKKTQTVTAVNKTYVMGDKNKAMGAKASTTLTYQSSDETVATVNAKGQITAKKAGTAKITATAKATTTYSSAKKAIIVTVKPKSPTLNIASPSEKVLKVAVTKVNGAHGYQMRYSTNADMSGAKTITSTSATKLITINEVGNTGVKYYVQARAYTTISEKNVYGSWCDAKAVTVKGHSHNWENEYEEIYHPATDGGTELVLVQEAWDEVIERAKPYCRTCGMDFTYMDYTEITLHLLDFTHASAVTTVEETIHHEAIYEEQEVGEIPAWTETKVIGATCTDCGETK